MSTFLRTDYLHEIFERQTDIGIKNLEKIFASLGNDIDVAWICGTDFGTQNATFCSLDSFIDSGFDTINPVQWTADLIR